MSIGGGNEIGASCYFLNIEGEKILLDVGKRFSHNPYPDFEFLTQNGYMAELNELSAILISHAHFDHAGAIPRIFDQVSRIDRCNWVYTTSETKSLLRLTLEEVLSPEYGKNTTLKVNGMLEEIQGIDWGYNVDLEKCKVVFYPAGHILGASMIRV